MLKKLRLVKDVQEYLGTVNGKPTYKPTIPAGTILEVEEVSNGDTCICGGKAGHGGAKVEEVEEKTNAKTGEGIEDLKTITYLDSMTFAQAWQKLIVEAEIPHYEWVDVKSFFPVDKYKNRIAEKPTGEMITVKTLNVLDCTPDMCNRSADERLKEDTEWLSPVAYLHWVSELWKDGKHLDEDTWTQFPNWRSEAGYVPDSDSGDSQVNLGRDVPGVSDPFLGCRPVHAVNPPSPETK
jgi:hypothetical protein